jgi:drug/metabolite transporter (DMT)-like permease
MSPAVAALLVNALLWGVSWWPFRYLAGLGLHALWSTAIVYALVSLLIVAARPAAVAQLLRSPALWPLLLASGLANAGFNWAVTIGDVIRVVLLFYLMPVWAVLLARWLLAEPLRGAVLARIALALAGAAIVLVPAEAGWPLPRSLADWLAIAGGASFAMTNVMLRRHAAAPAEGRALAMFAGGMLVAGGLAAALSSSGTIAALPLPDWRLAGGVLLLATMFLIGNLGLQYGAARLPANVTAVVMLTEIVFAAASAMLIGDEVATLRTAVGGAMILVSAALAARG